MGVVTVLVDVNVAIGKGAKKIEASECWIYLCTLISH